MDTELDGRLIALRQALAIAITLSTRGHPQATAMALELLDDLRANADSTPANAPFDPPAWIRGAQDELTALSRLVRGFTQTTEDDN